MNTNPDNIPDYEGADDELSDSQLPGDIVDDLDGPTVDDAIAEMALDAAQAGLEPVVFSTPTHEQIALSALAMAIQYIGVTRATNLPQVAKFLDLFGLPTKEDGKWVPFCAAGVSYATVKAYCTAMGITFTADNSVHVFRTQLPVLKKSFFLPSPSCYAIENDAKPRGTWLPKSTPVADIKPGYFVLYNWSGGTVPEHIGIVENAQQSLHTVEFNTSTADNSNGGAVSRRIRSYDCVVGFVKTY